MICTGNGKVVYSLIYNYDLEIKKMLNEKKISLRQAKISDLDNILNLYSERENCFKANGICQ